MFLVELLATAPVREYGKTELTLIIQSKLFEGIQEKTICWMSHTDYIEKAPEGFKIIAYTACLSSSSNGM